MKHILLAVLVVIAASADWALEPAGICAKDEVTCELARQRIERGGMWPDLARQQCRPRPGCFTARSECIEGYNCR